MKLMTHIATQGIARALCLLGLSACVSLEVHAQVPVQVRESTLQTPDAANRGLELMKASALAIGGVEALGRITDSVSQGSMIFYTTQGELAADVKAEVLYPDKVRIAVIFAAAQMIQGYDGKKAWMLQGAQTMDLPASMNYEMARSVILHAGIGLVRDSLSAGSEVWSLPAVEVNGKKMDALSCKVGAHTVALLLDPSTHRITKASFQSVTPQGVSNVESAWTEYRDFSGVKIPSKVVTFRDGKKFSELLLKDVKFNTGLKPAAFTKP